MDWKFTPLAEVHMKRNGYTVDDILGFIPGYLSEADHRGAVEQIDVNYHDFAGTHWRDSDGWTIDEDAGLARYPGDPPRQLIATARLRDERILFFNGAYIAVIQPDGSHRMTRID